MKNIFIKKLIDKIFDILVLLKSFFGFFEILAGIVFAVSGRLVVNNLIIALTQQEITEDPKDFFANYLIKVSNNFSSSMHIFAVVYLIFHGVVNIFLAVFLLKGKLWAYPAAIGLFLMFLIYQIYRYFYSYSGLLLFLIIFDVLFISMILLEYKKHIKKQSAL